MCCVVFSQYFVELREHFLPDVFMSGNVPRLLPPRRNFRTACLPGKVPWMKEWKTGSKENSECRRKRSPSPLFNSAFLSFTLLNLLKETFNFPAHLFCQREKWAKYIVVLRFNYVNPLYLYTLQQTQFILFRRRKKSGQKLRHSICWWSPLFRKLSKSWDSFEIRSNELDNCRPKRCMWTFRKIMNWTICDRQSLYVISFRVRALWIFNERQKGILWI